MRLKDKVAIITGGTGGIGIATAIRFVEEGASVILADLDEEKGKRVIAELAYGQEVIQFMAVDVTNEEAVEKLMVQTLKLFNKIDIIVNGAGINQQEMLIENLTFPNWQHIIAVNTTSIFFMMKHALPHMEAGSAIVNIASIAGMKGQKLVAAYTASKSAVIGLTKATATEYGRKNIRINAVAPGVIDTPMVDEWKATDKWPILSIANALKRLGKPREVAHTILFLASEEASFITGETVVVDGGTLNI
ncbi:SDR family oxidoreductase [Kurthia sibirica]|uniref:Short-chain dehydrogenase n=1 Tax=Kurthia sibirica TaxID=202750 RepID=A0A2U3AIJ6_9BACL|nr:SDR family oxidoreductase [Kurthia sibirica]PWI24369.1 short-chain dehydrogenase [Kurthia sibirica]GEK33786.1 3-oxoacyl-[acyl-carrier-protein] reductase FabG [Kurthia sibirica]